MAQQGHTSSCIDDSTTKFAQATATKITVDCTDMGIQTDNIVESLSTAIPIGSRSVVDSRGLLPASPEVTLGVNVVTSVVPFDANYHCHAICSWCNHSVDLQRRPLYRAKSALDDNIVHYLECSHCYHCTEFDM